jgi:Kef-type K+ transport system membrane component KefB
MAWQFYLVLQAFVALVCLRIAVSLVSELNVQRQIELDQPRKKRFHIHPVVENIITGILAGFGVETWMAFGRYMTDTGTSETPVDAPPRTNLSLVLFYAMTFLLAIVIWCTYVWHKSLVVVSSSSSSSSTPASTKTTTRRHSNYGATERVADTGLAVGVTALTCAFVFYAIGPVHRAFD